MFYHPYLCVINTSTHNLQGKYISHWYHTALVMSSAIPAKGELHHIGNVLLILFALQPALRHHSQASKAGRRSLHLHLIELHEAFQRKLSPTLIPAATGWCPASLSW